MCIWLELGRHRNNSKILWQKDGREEKWDGKKVEKKEIADESPHSKTDWKSGAVQKHSPGLIGDK